MGIKPQHVEYGVLGIATSLVVYQLYNILTTGHDVERREADKTDTNAASSNTNSNSISNNSTNNNSNRSRKRNKIKRRGPHGNPLPRILSKPGPYSPEAHRLFQALEQLGKDTTRSNTVIHYGSTCSECMTEDIQGTRYVCSECENTSICERCEMAYRHDLSHLLYKIDRYYPQQVESTNLVSGVPSWRSQKNIDLIGTPRLAPALTFELTENMKQIAGINTNSSEIEALYDQYKCFIDMVIGENKVAASTESFKSMLPNDFYGKFPALDNFFLQFYDKDSKGYVTFADYVQGIYFILGNDQCAKVHSIINSCPSNLNIKDYLRQILHAYLKLGDLAFRDAENLQSFQYTFHQDYDYNDQKPSFSSQQHHEDLLWENRSEINSAATYDPFSKEPEHEAMMELQRDVQVEQLLNAIVVPGRKNNAKEVIDRILDDNSLTCAVVAFLEAGIP